jgi:hypothetical protein
MALLKIRILEDKLIRTTLEISSKKRKPYQKQRSKMEEEKMKIARELAISMFSKVFLGQLVQWLIMNIALESPTLSETAEEAYL